MSYDDDTPLHSSFDNTLPHSKLHSSGDDITSPLSRSEALNSSGGDVANPSPAPSSSWSEMIDVLTDSTFVCNQSPAAPSPATSAPQTTDSSDGDATPQKSKRETPKKGQYDQDEAREDAERCLKKVGDKYECRVCGQLLGSYIFEPSKWAKHRQTDIHQNKLEKQQQAQFTTAISAAASLGESSTAMAAAASPSTSAERSQSADIDLWREFLASPELELSPADVELYATRLDSEAVRFSQLADLADVDLREPIQKAVQFKAGHLTGMLKKIASMKKKASPTKS